MDNIGFVGMGNMAQALAGGFIGSGKIKPENIYAYAPHQDKLKNTCGTLGINPAESIEALLDRADIVFIACKPYQIEDALSGVKEKLTEKPVISVAAGYSLEKYRELLGDKLRLQYVMPNTPAAVGEGVFLFEEENTLPEDIRSKIKELFSQIGLTVELPGRLMGIGMAISGCSPAFADLFIEAYADAAVKYGMDRKTAYSLVSQTLLGSAKLQLETGKHPAQLKDEVCSPGGTTIKGVAELERKGFRDACISSIDAIMKPH